MYGERLGKCKDLGKFQILIGNVSYMSVNAETKFELSNFPFDRVGAPNVH